jgi:hypothetical protein
LLLFSASLILNCFGCLDFITSSFSFLNLSNSFSSSCFLFSNFSLSFLVFTLGERQKPSPTKSSFISFSLPGILKTFLVKFTGENLKSITKEVRKIKINASRVAILQSKGSKYK